MFSIVWDTRLIYTRRDEMRSIISALASISVGMGLGKEAGGSRQLDQENDNSVTSASKQFG